MHFVLAAGPATFEIELRRFLYMKAGAWGLFVAPDALPRSAEGGRWWSAERTPSGRRFHILRRWEVVIDRDR